LLLYTTVQKFGVVISPPCFSYYSPVGWWAQGMVHWIGVVFVSLPLALSQRGDGSAVGMPAAKKTHCTRLLSHSHAYIQDRDKKQGRDGQTVQTEFS